jgi:hypothetical protein
MSCFHYVTQYSFLGYQSSVIEAPFAVSGPRFASGAEMLPRVQEARSNVTVHLATGTMIWVGLLSSALAARCAAIGNTARLLTDE